jgi:hypothetical protein
LFTVFFSLSPRKLSSVLWQALAISSADSVVYEFFIAFHDPEVSLA